MLWFWTPVVLPLCEAVEAALLLEIGAGSGHNTRNLLRYAEPRGATVHVIEPSPTFDPTALEVPRPEALVVHRDRSHVVIPQLSTPDVALIDGDHNWWTVHGELSLLEARATGDGKPFPLVLVHDVSWPYGRRDTYADPAAIPAEFRHPHRQAGIVPGQAGLSDDRGINGGAFNAEVEGTERNGVLTAVEDFVAESSLDFRLELLPGLGGLAVLVDRASLEARPELADRLDSFATPDFLFAHATRMEAAMGRAQMALADARREIRDTRRELARLERAAPAPTPASTPPPAEATTSPPAVASPNRQPSPLDELHVVGRLPEGPARALRGVCTVEPAEALTSATSFVLVGTDGDGVEEAQELVEEATRLGVPSILWAIQDRSRLAPWHNLARLCSHVVVADPDAAPDFASANASPPILPLAADLTTPVAGGAANGHRSGVVFAGEYGTDWLAGEQRVVGMLLAAARAAGEDLRIIVPDTGVAARVGDGLGDLCEIAPSAEERLGAIARAKVLVAFTPGLESREFVSEVAFQGVALGTPVIHFPNAGVRHHLGESATLARTAEEVTAAVRHLAERGPELDATIRYWQNVVRTGHNYRSRLASLASLVGVRAFA